MGKSCGNCIMISLIALVLFLIIAAGGYLAVTKLTTKPVDDEIVRNRHYTRDEKDSSEENSFEFVKKDGKLKKVGKKALKCVKWATAPIWCVPYLMYKNTYFEKVATFGIVVALMATGVPNGIMFMMGIGIMFVLARYYFPLNPGRI